MSLGRFIFFSFLIHSILFLIIEKPITINTEPSFSGTILANLTKKKLEENENKFLKKTRIVQKKTIAIVTEKKLISEIKNEPILEDETSLNEDAFINYDNVEKKYYSISEVDINALPVSNIDISMFADIKITGMPIKIRIYISDLGKVDRIEKLYAEAQDEEFLIRIESLLADTAFLPAKKNGISVDFFQDFELFI